MWGGLKLSSTQTPSVACLPCTGHAQTGPSPDTVAKVVMNMRSEFKQLSQPSSSHTDERLEVVKKEESFLRGIVRLVVAITAYRLSTGYHDITLTIIICRSVKTLFGWT